MCRLSRDIKCYPQKKVLLLLLLLLLLGETWLSKHCSFIQNFSMLPDPNHAISIQRKFFSLT